MRESDDKVELSDLKKTVRRLGDVVGRRVVDLSGSELDIETRSL